LNNPVYPEYCTGLERTACGVLKKERTTSQLAEELTQRPCLKLFIFMGHDCLMFQAAVRSKGRIKIQYPHLGLVMHGIMCFYVVLDAHCVMLGRVQLHAECSIRLEHNIQYIQF